MITSIIFFCIFAFVKGLRLLQKAKKDRFEIVTRKEGDTRPSKMRRTFRSINTELDDEDDGEGDDSVDLEQKIK